MEKSERFELFVRELGEAVPAATFEEARLLLDTILNSVEDRHSGATFNPDNWRSDGRLYPPQDDREIESGVPGVRTFKTVGHYVDIAANGAIRIMRIGTGPAGSVIAIDKPGSDGVFCPPKAD